MTRSLEIGGAQRHIAKLCQGVDRKEVELYVYLNVPDELADLKSDVANAGVPVITSPYHRRDPRVTRWFAREFDRAGIDVVHSFLWTADAFAALSDLLFHPAPLICSERGDRGYVGYTKARNLYDRLVTFRRASAVCANSRFGGEILVKSGCDPRKVRVIPNGVDLKRVDSMTALDIRARYGWSANAPIVGITSRLIDYKGVDTLVEAMVDVVARSTANCVILGDGPQRAELEATVVARALGGRVKFAGSQSPSEPWVKSFDVAVLTTRTETEHCSNSILEYMACSRAVVATRVAGVPELVIEGQTGLLVRSDAPKQMAEAIISLIDDRARATEMGRQGRGRIEQHYRLERVVSEFVALWKEVAAAR